MTSMRLDDVAPTSTRRYFDVVCLLGKGKLYFERAVSSREELSHVDEKKTQGKTWLLVAFDQGSPRNLSQATTFGFFRRFHCTSDINNDVLETPMALLKRTLPLNQSDLKVKSV